MSHVILDNSFRKKKAHERLQVFDTVLHAGEKLDSSYSLARTKTDFLLPNSEIAQYSDSLIENVIGCFPIPIGIVRNLQVNNTYYNVPLATEEATVVAAADYAAKIITSASADGIRAKSAPALQIAQIALLHVSSAGEQALQKKWSEIQNFLMRQLASMHKRGGGLRSSEYRRLPSGMIVFHFTADVRNAMGANVVTEAAEQLAPILEKICGGRRLSAILSNFSDQRIASASCIIDARKLPAKNRSGMEIAAMIAHMSNWAKEDLYRCVTHNKGIMNGVHALALATGNDSRALEAAAHSLALSCCSNKQHFNSMSPLSEYDYSDSQLKVHIQIPALLATKGGATKHPVAQYCLKILASSKKKELHAYHLNCIAAALGLAQNFAALFSLVSEGIRHAHHKAQ